ncbi:hypothetical protein [Polycladidibacter hongkongensis]|uniref:hypothetical protein n=1 Tax=Polycladidibacter hongkongensis TaxID=1647556 RepID=UPI0008344918|nr:hypothetical protein [Pseudovibrio hongkongensis]
MGSIRVFGDNPSNGPSHYASIAARDQVNEENPGWYVELDYDASVTTARYTSATADDDQLIAAFTPLFPGMHVVK